MPGNPGARRDTGARCASEQQRQACDSSHKTHRNPSRAASPRTATRRSVCGDGSQSSHQVAGSSSASALVSHRLLPLRRARCTGCRLQTPATPGGCWGASSLALLVRLGWWGIRLAPRDSAAFASRSGLGLGDNTDSSSSVSVAVGRPRPLTRRMTDRRHQTSQGAARRRHRELRVPRRVQVRQVGKMNMWSPWGAATRSPRDSSMAC
jgi:hypothetical protein